jgi:hypothetical protein
MSQAEEFAAAIIQPHWDAVRDTYVEYAPAKSMKGLSKLKKTKFIVDSDIHDTPRHFAACRDDGMQMIFAPELVELPIENLIAILAHEFGHAADFAYPGSWAWPIEGPGHTEWVGDSQPGRSMAWRGMKRTWGGTIDTMLEPQESESVAWMRAWEKRNRDQIEWTADAIAMAVTGHRLGYCGSCMLQTFDRCVERPAGLR